MPEYSQAERIIKIATPLGPDALFLQSFTGREGISQLFSFQCECLSENALISYDDVIGKKITISVTQVDENVRYFNGICSRFSQSGQDERFTYYRVEIVPWLWLLSRTSNCRIFQQKTPTDIIQQIFADSGFTDYAFEVSGSLPTLDYCVQYRETDLNFVCRLMEQYGISYFFRHEDQKHTLVLANAASSYKPCPGAKAVRYHTTLGSFNYDEDVLTGMEIAKEVRPGKYTLNDFDFEKPLVDLTSSTAGADTRKFELYDYPGEYKTKGDGDALAQVRMEEEETPTVVVRASSSCRAFTSGYRFELKEHYRGDLNKEYILTEVQHAGTVGQHYQSSNGSEGEHYFNYFVAIPYPTKFRPPRLTPKPIVQGPQTAIVVGPPGEEIYVDKYGRVKVQFHWDREGKYDDKSSCWIRVSQLWAGKMWGAMYIPRIGQEVIVEFLEGDPDQPLITGRVYNAECMPPYALPDEKTKSTLRSYSSKGGSGFNEFRIEDKKGSEQIFFHGEKDYDLRLKNDRKKFIGRDEHNIVKRDQIEKVERNKHQEIKGDHNMKVGSTASWTQGQDFQHKIGMKYAVQAGMEVHMKAGTNMVLESGTSLTLKVGGNFININPGGVFISGTMVMINSGGSAGSGAGCSPASPDPPLEADTAQPGQKPQLPPTKPPRTPGTYSPGAVVLQQAAHTGMPFCDI